MSRWHKYTGVLIDPIQARRRLNYPEGNLASGKPYRCENHAAWLNAHVLSFVPTNAVHKILYRWYQHRSLTVYFGRVLRYNGVQRMHGFCVCTHTKQTKLCGFVVRRRNHIYAKRARRTVERRPYTPGSTHACIPIVRIVQHKVVVLHSRSRNLCRWDAIVNKINRFQVEGLLHNNLCQRRVSKSDISRKRAVFSCQTQQRTTLSSGGPRVQCRTACLGHR